MSDRPLELVACAVTKTYRVGRIEVEALRGACLAVPKGEFVAVMGPSGCGKSTLLHALGGLLTPTSGRISVGGEDLSSRSDGERTDLRRRRIGIVFQKYNLLSTLSVEGNLLLQERISERSASTSRRSELLERLGLAAKRRHRPAELSGGEQQRAAIARALVHEPAILLLDEPTGNLDSRNAENVLETLRSLHRELSPTIVLITHDRDVASAADRTVSMKDGVIQL